MLEDRKHKRDTIVEHAYAALKQRLIVIRQGKQKARARSGMGGVGNVIVVEPRAQAER